MDNIKLYFKYIAINIKSELEYKATLIFNILNQIVLFFTYYFVVIALFDRFKVLNQYTVYEILFVFSICQLGFSINEVFSRGIDHFSKLIIKGDLDRLLIRPRPLLLQALGSEIEITKIAKVIQALICLIIALIHLKIHYNLFKILGILFMIIGAVVLFLSILILGASFCFVTIQGLEVVNVFTYGGRDMAQYPIDIYNKTFKVIFTYIIPFGLINYYPFLYIVEKSNTTSYIFLPLSTLLHLAFAIFIFNKSVNKYTSTGS